MARQTYIPNGFRGPVEAFEAMLRENGVRVVTGAEIERFSYGSPDGLLIDGVCYRDTSSVSFGGRGSGSSESKKSDSEPSYLESLSQFQKGTYVKLQQESEVSKSGGARRATTKVVQTPPGEAVFLCHKGFHGVVAAADYNHVENEILGTEKRNPPTPTSGRKMTARCFRPRCCCSTSASTARSRA